MKGGEDREEKGWKCMEGWKKWLGRNKEVVEIGKDGETVGDGRERKGKEEREKRT